MAAIRLSKAKRTSLLTALKKHYAVANPKPRLTKETTTKIKTALENMPSQLYIKAAQNLPEYKTLLNSGFNPSDYKIKIDLSADNRFMHTFWSKIVTTSEKRINIKIGPTNTDFITIDLELNGVNELTFYYISESQNPRYNRMQILTVHQDELPPQYGVYLQEQLQKETEWATKEKTYLNAFKRLLDDCTTLNQVIKAYPESIHLLDQKTRTALEKKPKKSIRPKIEFSHGEADVIVPAKTISLITNQPIGQ